MSNSSTNFSMNAKIGIRNASHRLLGHLSCSPLPLLLRSFSRLYSNNLPADRSYSAPLDDHGHEGPDHAAHSVLSIAVLADLVIGLWLELSKIRRRHLGEGEGALDELRVIYAYR